MKVTKHAQGVPSWAELMTTDEAGALAFYGSLFGWTDDPVPLPAEYGGGAYHQQRLAGALVAAVGLQNEGERSQGVPPHWTVSLAVDDAEQVAGRVAAAGGNVIVPAMDVFDYGRMAVLADPTGAVVSLWQAKSHTGFEVIEEPGAVTWCELMTDDAERAAAFFRTVLEVPTELMPGERGSAPYTLLGPAQGQHAGIMSKGPDMVHVPNSWSVYFEVADCDAAVAKAVALGGAVVRSPMDIMPGRFAVLTDPQGAAFCIIKSAPMPV
jgi:predicted enzyme related to lactoylglutathione lyase